MGTLENHLDLYRNFKKDAVNKDNFEGTRVETYFLSAFHLIESCAAKERVHINKHQRVRQVLEENKFILEDEAEIVWRNFQRIENQLRPKFAYGFSWTNKDMSEVEKHYRVIEKICLEKLDLL